MSKGLDSLKQIIDEYGHPSNYAKSLFDIIEKDLKRLEEIDNGAYVLVHINRYNELCDKEKALEIIKEKRVWVDALIKMSLKEYNDYCKYVWNTPELTQEEYNLLNEVL